MKITRRQLRRIIREAWQAEREHYYSTDKPRGGGAIGNRGFGWADFQAMAQTGDFQGAGDWLQDLAHDRGLNVDREIEDAMIQIGADPNSTAKDLEVEFEALTGGW